MNRITRTFTLHIQPAENGSYGIQLTVTTADNATVIAELDGQKLDRIRPALVSAATSSDHARTVLSPTRKKPIPLTEDAGVRLALVTLATLPISKPVRVEQIRAGIDMMTSEEALYWYAHCTGPDRNRALKALRILLAEE